MIRPVARDSEARGSTSELYRPAAAIVSFHSGLFHSV
jgi:hypothetical protein